MRSHFFGENWQNQVVSCLKSPDDFTLKMFELR